MNTLPTALGLTLMHAGWQALLAAALYRLCDLCLTRLSGRARGALRLRLAGSPTAAGGLDVSRSAVALGPAGDPGHYQGKLRSIDDGEMVALVGATDGTVLRLHMRLRFDGSAANGTLTATPEAG